MTGAEIVRQCIKEAAERYRVRPADILGRGRTKIVNAARREAMVDAYMRTKFSTPQIGRFFDRDHSTVVYALRRAREAA